jgi:hypothetical protein
MSCNWILQGQPGHTKFFSFLIFSLTRPGFSLGSFGFQADPPGQTTFENYAYIDLSSSWLKCHKLDSCGKYDVCRCSDAISILLPRHPQPTFKLSQIVFRGNSTGIQYIVAETFATLYQFSSGGWWWNWNVCACPEGFFSLTPIIFFILFSLSLFLIYDPLNFKSCSSIFFYIWSLFF